MIDVKKLLSKMLGTQTQTLTPASEFSLYNNTEPITLRVAGHIAYLHGEVKPTSTIAGSTTTHLLCTIPSQYAPKENIQLVMHGSGNAEWMLSISTSGDCNFSRYRNTANNADSYKDANNAVWIPFTASWVF